MPRTFVTQSRMASFTASLSVFWPDSTATAFDKRNIRDGHYPLWTHMRYIMEFQAGVPFSDNGQASADRTKKFIDIMLGTVTAANLDIVLDVVQTGNVPGCAAPAAAQNAASRLPIRTRIILSPEPALMTGLSKVHNARP